MKNRRKTHFVAAVFLVSFLSIFCLFSFKETAFGIDLPDPASSYRTVKLNIPIPLAGTPEVPVEGSGFFLNYLGYVVTWATSLLGMVCVGVFIFSGFQIMANFGNTEMVTQAKDRILATIFGLILLITSALLLHTINPGFFRWSSEYENPDPSNFYYGTSIKLEAVGEGSDCNEAREQAQERLDDLVESCREQNRQEAQFRIYPFPPQEFSDIVAGECEVHLVQYCSWQEEAD